MLLVSKVQRSSKGIFSTFHVLTFAIDTPVIEFLKCLFMMQNTQYTQQTLWSHSHLSLSQCTVMR